MDFFKKHHKSGSPVIFAGDFNFRPGLGHESYLNFVAGTKLEHAGKYCIDKGCARSKDDGWHGIWERAVDHQFYSKHGVIQIIPQFIERTYRDMVDGYKLSDHPMHEVRYELRWGSLKTKETVMRD